MRYPELDYVLWHNFYSSKAGCRVNGRFQIIFKMTQYLCKKADVPVFGLHQLRHLATAILKSYGKLSIAELQLFLRMITKKTTEIYAGHLDTGTQVQADVLDNFRHKQMSGVAAE